MPSDLLQYYLSHWHLWNGSVFSVWYHLTSWATWVGHEILRAFSWLFSASGGASHVHWTWSRSIYVSQFHGILDLILALTTICSILDWMNTLDLELVSVEHSWILMDLTFIGLNLHDKCLLTCWLSGIYVVFVSDYFWVAEEAVTVHVEGQQS